MKEFTPKNLDTLRAEINKALEGVSKKHNIAIKMGNISYSPDSFRTKLEALIVNDEMSNMKKSHITPFNNLKKYGFRYGVGEADYGKMLTRMGRKYKFVGIMPRSPKYPVIMESLVDGKTYKFSEYSLKELK